MSAVMIDIVVKIPPPPAPASLVMTRLVLWAGKEMEKTHKSAQDQGLHCRGQATSQGPNCTESYGGLVCASPTKSIGEAAVERGKRARGEKE
jgi:hypothetical protein